MSTDLKIFSQTCDKLYDRHHYKMVYSNNQSIVVDSWEKVRQVWWETPSNFASHIEVIDIVNQNKKSKSIGGFK
jgi:cystathionine beta-lyase/cystathionine gamma-synthase